MIAAPASGIWAGLAAASSPASERRSSRYAGSPEYLNCSTARVPASTRAQTLPPLSGIADLGALRRTFLARPDRYV